MIKNFDRLDTSIKSRIDQEKHYIHYIKNGLVKIIHDLHSCHDSLIDELTSGKMSNAKRDELAELIESTDRRIRTFADYNDVPLAEVRPVNKNNPFRPEFWERPPPVAIRAPESHPRVPNPYDPTDDKGETPNAYSPPSYESVTSKNPPQTFSMDDMPKCSNVKHKNKVLTSVDSILESSNQYNPEQSGYYNAPPEPDIYGNNYFGGTRRRKRRKRTRR